METLRKIFEFLNSKIFGYILVAILTIFIINMCNRNNSLEEEINRKNNNIEALSDTLKQEQLKSGELQASIQGFIAKNEELRLLNEDLYEQVEEEKGNVITLTNIIFKLQQDTTDLRKYIDSLKTFYEDPIQINDTVWEVNWSLAFTYDEYNYDAYSGRTTIGVFLPEDNLRITHIGTEMLDRDSQMRLTWGQTIEDGRLRIFARTAHPAFKAQLLEGVYVDYGDLEELRRNWFTGFGLGPSLTIGYDVINQRPTFVIGASIHYNIFQW